MFSLFKKSGVPEFSTTDKVWKTENGALKGMLMMAMMRLQKNRPALIVTFFEAEYQKTTSFMSKNQITFFEVNESSSAASMTEAQIYITTTKAINSSVVSDWVGRHAEQFGRAIYFPGHYPITAPESKTLGTLRGLGFAEFVFCLSFDDPLMKVFGANKIVSLLENLGLDENEAIEHAMVTQSIQRARQKLDKQVGKEIETKSPAEWFALNVRP